MTVRELIERLRELPPDAIAMVRDVDGDLAEVNDADLLHGDVMRVYITGNF